MAQPSQPDFQKKASPAPVTTPSQAMAPRPFAPQVDVAAPDIQAPDVAAPDAPALDSAPAFPKLNFQIRAAGESPPPLQPKLTIGPPNDPYEQEADRVAEQVVQRIHAPAVDRLQPQALVHPNQPTIHRDHPLQSLSLQREARPEFREPSPIKLSFSDGRVASNISTPVERSTNGVQIPGAGVSSPMIQLARGPEARENLGDLGRQAASQTFYGSDTGDTTDAPTAVPIARTDRSYNAVPVTIGGTPADNYVLKGRQYNPLPTFSTGTSQGKAVILFSGSGGNNETMMEPLADLYCKQGATVYGINYRGFGQSKDVDLATGQSTTILPSEQGIYDDSRRIFDFVSQTFNPTDIVLHGFSMGGPVAAHLAKKLAKVGINIGGLVLHSAMKDEYSAAKDALISDGTAPLIAKGMALGAQAAVGTFDTAKYLRQLAKRDPNLPIHFMSGKLADGDQLALSHTGLKQIAKKAGMANITSRETSGAHLSGGGTVPSQHLGTVNEMMLNQLVQEGRNRA